MGTDFIKLTPLASKKEKENMKVSKELVKKITPIVVGLIIAAVGVLFGLGVLTADVQKVTVITEGELVTFVAGADAVMVKADIDITLEGTNVASGAAWILYGLEPKAEDKPVEPTEPVTPPTE